ncbi:sel1 repeat family protein [Rhizobiales bacterium Sp-1]|uniref:Sel1 repeat family protein n=2 Tax=Segnochrobactrum spirostomi TaxID=2608987 RepID=A0A6A7Y8F7_9HYPH|nr:sel1 repeat family protein [Segnochrobactrum spirostomi]
MKLQRTLPLSEPFAIRLVPTIAVAGLCRKLAGFAFAMARLGRRNAGMAWQDVSIGGCDTHGRGPFGTSAPAGREAAAIGSLQRRTFGIMRSTCWRFIAGGLVALGLGGPITVQSALAFDANAPAESDEAASADMFRAGTKAYFAGDKAKAADAFGFAADKGHPVAQWKLGRMYQEGDGVATDDYKAFELFSEVANDHADDAPHSAQAPFVSNSFVELGVYYLNGIKDTAVTPNVERARELFTYAASYFGDADAQYHLGLLYLDPAREKERDPRLGARWLKLAAEKGHAAAQARLGEMLVEGTDLKRNVVAGLMWLTVASAHADDRDEAWIREAQEDAMAIATEKERRRATQLAEQVLAKSGEADKAADVANSADQAPSRVVGDASR